MRRFIRRGASRLPWFVGCLLSLAGCSEDSPPPADDPGEPDAAVVDPDEPDAAPDEVEPFVAPAAIPLGLSATGPDQVQSAVAGPDGSFYVVGFAAAGVAATDARIVEVIKLTSSGNFDTSFGGGDGIATTDMDFRGGSGELDLAVQPSGKIVVSATVANLATPTDRDIALQRLLPDGTIDASFGDAGIRRLDLNSAIMSGANLTGFDGSRGIDVDSNGRIFVHAVQRGEGLYEGNPRTDNDFALVCLDANGNIDTGFNGGKYLLDIRAGGSGIPSAGTPRSVYRLPDGSVLGAGYATTDGLGAGAQPVLYKLDNNGVPVAGFAIGGVFHDAVLTTQTEVYGVAVHGTHLVTAGYGRESGDQNDWVSMRFNIATGERDLSWGGTANGVVMIDPSGNQVGDNCRNAIALPGGKTLLTGSTGPGNMPAQDAVYAVLDATGHLDAAYGSGVHIYPLGEGAGGNDQFWGGAVSGESALVVGYRGGGPAASQTAELNDDSYVVLLPLR